MLLSYKLVCICLTTASVRAFKAAVIFGAGGRKATRFMSSVGEGQADIGNVNNDELFDAVEGSWRELLEVSSRRSRKIRGSNYVQLATVESNEPRCRTVVFRGFLKVSDVHPIQNTCNDMSCLMKMITDERSQKVLQVTTHPHSSAEMVWWFPKTSEQYRIRGELILVGGGKYKYDSEKELSTARKEMWGNISDSSRESFFAKEVPGALYSGESPVPKAGRDEEGTLLPAPDDFLLMLLSPVRVDYLRLTNMYRQVDELVDGKWQSNRVNP